MEENAKKKRWPWVVGAVVIVCAVAVALIVWMNVSGSEETDSVLAETGKAGAVDAESDEEPFTWETFDGTEEEFMDEVANRMPKGPELSDYPVRGVDEDGTPYREQLIDIIFPREVGEKRAHQIVDEFGGEFISSYFGIADAADLDEVIVYTVFPEGTDVLAVSKEIEAHPEVIQACPAYYIIGTGA